MNRKTFRVNTTRSFSQAQEKWSVDEFGDVVVDVTPVRVGLIMTFDHLFAFLLTVRFERSQRRRHDLQFCGADQIEAQPKQVVETMRHDCAAMAPQQHSASIAQGGGDFVAELMRSDE